MQPYAYTSEQLEIIDCVKEMCSNEILKINAFAGTGKTSTLVAIAKALPYKRFLYLAFNSSIVEESRQKFPSNVTILTTHSLAYRRIVTPSKTQVNPHDFKAADVSVWYGIEAGVASSALAIFNEFLSSKKEEINSAISYEHKIAKRIYEEIRSGIRPMTHSFYLKEYQLLSEKEKGLPSYDFVLLDEAQDTNDVTLDIFMKIDAGKILVGDTHQAIYSWRGAENAMDKIVADFNFYLTKTFRCIQPIVDRANFVLRSFKGENTQIISGCIKEPSDNTYAVITRTNAKLIENLAEYDDDYKIIKHPESIFSTAINLHNWLIGDFEKIVRPEFEYLKRFKNRTLLEKYIEETGSLELKTSLSIAQRYKKGLFLLYKKAADGYRSARDESGKIIKHENDTRIVLTTGHASKGLEFDRVDIESDFPDLAEEYMKLERDKEQLNEEANLYYVAITRAKYHLTDISKNEKMFS